MSNDVFPPSGISFGWGMNHGPVHRTIKSPVESGASTRRVGRAFPVWEYEMTFPRIGRSNSIFGDQVETLFGFYNRHHGAAESFRINDPDFNTFTDQLLDTGNGAQKKFRLLAEYGGVTEPLSEIKASPALVLRNQGGTVLTGWTESAGVVTFTVAPGVGVEVRATGGFYRRVYFAEDKLTLSLFTWRIERAGGIRLEEKPVIP